MDPRTESDATDLVVMGVGAAFLARDAPCDPIPYLRTKKLRKYMSRQDDLAVIAAGRAIIDARIASFAVPERVGLFAAIGHIPFERRDLEPLVAAATSDGRFSMRRLSTDGYHKVNGLLTFHCLPNMPAFHVSANFEIQGPYVVGYPGPAQYYLAIEQARAAFSRGEIDTALILGVACQRNFLVEHHFRRLDPPLGNDFLYDAAACMIVEPASNAVARGKSCVARLTRLSLSYRCHNPIEDRLAIDESWEIEGNIRAISGEHPASLALELAHLIQTNRNSTARHWLTTRDGYAASSEWRVT